MTLTVTADEANPVGAISTGVVDTAMDDRANSVFEPNEREWRVSPDSVLTKTYDLPAALKIMRTGER